MKSQSAPEASADTNARYLETQDAISKNHMLRFYLSKWLRFVFFFCDCVSRDVK